MLKPSLPALAVSFLLAACAGAGSSDPAGAGDSPPASTVPGRAAVLVVGDGGPAGPGLTVADALGHRATDDLVSVTGALFVEADGTVKLCDAIAESFPPQCAGASLLVESLDLDSIADLQEGGGVRWAEQVTLFGSVE